MIAFVDLVRGTVIRYKSDTPSGALRGALSARPGAPRIAVPGAPRGPLVAPLIHARDALRAGGPGVVQTGRTGPLVDVDQPRPLGGGDHLVGGLLPQRHPREQRLTEVPLVQPGAGDRKSVVQGKRAGEGRARGG